jgi:hypothetical protein
MEFVSTIKMSSSPAPSAAALPLFFYDCNLSLFSINMKLKLCGMSVSHHHRQPATSINYDRAQRSLHPRTLSPQQVVTSSLRV